MVSYPLTFIISLMATACTLMILKRWLPSHFLSAQINARSNHTTAARQIGGLACTPVCIIAIVISTLTGILPAKLGICLTISAIILCTAGYLDDKQELSVLIRLPIQLSTAMLAIFGLGPSFQLLPNLIPYWLETILLCIVILSSINITNFMDGLDWLTVCGIGIPLLLLGIIGACILNSPMIAIIGFALSGTLTAFAHFNRPPAAIFLGDSGSLPLGLITGIAFLLFAQQAGIIVALTLPLYYCVDSASTIILRLRKGENILRAHSSHAYQIAKRSGKTVYNIAGSITALNITLGIITAISMTVGTTAAHITGFMIGLLLTASLIRYFRH